MSTANVFVKVGTTVARVHPENREKTQLLLERASKIKTPKQFRAAVNATKCVRHFPKHFGGMSTQRYVQEYYAANQNTFAGTFSARDDFFESVYTFFEPLSTSPQFAQSGEVIEEALV